MTAAAGVAAAPRAGVADTVRALVAVLGPNVAQGVIARRPAVVALAERWQLDAAVVHAMQRLRAVHGRGPLRLRVPGRELALVLDGDDVHRVLHGTPEPFTPANAEKRAALGQFQPHGVLVSQGAERRARRRLNEHVLDTGHPVHADAAAIVDAVRAEVTDLLDRIDDSDPVLRWTDAHRSWRRAVRRVVLGEQALDDVRVHALMDRLRGRANWSFLAPRDRRARAELRERLAGHVERATAGSLAARLRDADPDGGVDPVDQIPQWLFAADPALMVAHRALALLAVDPDERARARTQLDADDGPAPLLPRMRAAVLESARLWPTTPLILRDTTEVTDWPTGRVPAGTGMLVVAPFFHRDDRTEPTAHRFAPSNWLTADGEGLDETAHDHRPLVPFSEGPASCPGQDLVLLMTSTWLAALLDRHEVAPRTAVSLDPSSLPASFSPFGLAFGLCGRR